MTDLTGINAIIKDKNVNVEMKNDKLVVSKIQKEDNINSIMPLISNSSKIIKQILIFFLKFRK